MHSKIASRLPRLFFGTKTRTVLTTTVVVLLVFVVGLAWLYRYIVTGGLVARKEPPGFETFIARRLVDLSIPDAAKSPKNPVSARRAREADLAAGRDVYQRRLPSLSRL